MKLTLLLERISDIVYRLIPGTTAYRNLKTNTFQLSMVYGDDSRDYRPQKGRLFYLSTSRTPDNSYFLQERNLITVIFVLDGKKLSQNYKGGPVNFYYTQSKSRRRYFEAEDRIISNKAFIPNAVKYIKEVHVYYEQSQSTNIKLLTALDSLIKQNGLMVHYYFDDYMNFMKLNTRKATTQLELGWFKDKYQPSDTEKMPVDENPIVNTALYQLLKFYETKNSSVITDDVLIGYLSDINRIYNSHNTLNKKQAVYDRAEIAAEYIFKEENKRRRSLEYSSLLNKFARIIKREKTDYVDFMMKMALLYK